MMNDDDDNDDDDDDDLDHHQPLLQDKSCRFDSRTLKKMLTPVGGATGSDSPLTSPVTIIVIFLIINTDHHDHDHRYH